MFYSDCFNLESVALHPVYTCFLRTLEVTSMSAAENRNELKAGELEWREAIVEVERARADYATHVDSDHEDEYVAGRRWLRLWRAERRRDELMRI
jgi:hypothetical protein